MITLYSGTPGSGKSLHLAERLYYRLRSGKTVIANFALKLDRIRKKDPDRLPFLFVQNTKLTPKFLVDYSREYFKDKSIKEAEILLVIDEAQLLFSNRSWNDSRRPSWLAFFSQHRKFGYEIIFVAQFDGMIDRQIRSLIEYNVVHRKASNFGKGGKFISLFGGGKLFVGVKIWYPLNEKVGTEFFRVKKKFLEIYDTYYSFYSNDLFSFPASEGSSGGSAAPDASEDAADAADLSEELEDCK